MISHEFFSMLRTNYMYSKTEYIGSSNIRKAMVHIDITDVDPTELNWRAWLAGRMGNKRNTCGPSIVGQGVQRVLIMAFNDFDPNHLAP